MNRPTKPSHDVVELCGKETDPNNPPGDYFHTHVKSARNRHKPGVGFLYGQKQLGRHEKIYPADVVHEPKPVPIKPKFTAAQQVDLKLEALDELPQEQPEDVKDVVDRLLPTRTYRLGGSSMIHSPGLVSYAQRLYRSRSRKDREQAMALISAWPGMPEDVRISILKGNCHVEAEGDTAVITIKDY